MGLLNKNWECSDFRSRLDNAATDAPHANSIAALLSALPIALQQHAQSCGECRQAAEDIVTARQALAGFPSSAQLASPWFAGRVMAAIAERKAELARAADTWTFFPRLAAHLTWASSVALLLASAWLYQKPASVPAEPSARAVATDITGEPLVENSAPQTSDDDALLSLIEKDKKPQ
jgi:hypothetical protein